MAAVIISSLQEYFEIRDNFSQVPIRMSGSFTGTQKKMVVCICYLKISFCAFITSFGFVQ